MQFKWVPDTGNLKIEFEWGLQIFQMYFMFCPVQFPLVKLRLFFPGATPTRANTAVSALRTTSPLPVTVTAPATGAPSATNVSDKFLVVLALSGRAYLYHFQSTEYRRMRAQLEANPKACFDMFLLKF